MPFHNTIPPERLVLARIQRGQGWSWREIALNSPWSHEGIRYALNREQIRAKRTAQRKAKKEASRE